ncbi:MAG: OmpA family protein [Limimaricola sp.]|uniref:OmpA family protein n=1 Tax=Limimaricola sp. TaxID=2211665 RepID=UPI001DEAC022|nr:OmpA family protein [Limimaricola sp.]MBI1415882.1 OmpA family protein [Limimaricola sp.]
MKLTLALSVLTLATGCSQMDTLFPAFNREAGSMVNTGDFGNSTQNNTLVQSGDQGYTVMLARRFAAEVPNTVNFAFNSSLLDGQAQATLRRQADWIKQFPEVRFKVFGYADAVGTNAYNYRLGLRRANTVVGFLVSEGISRSRLQAVVSYGETRPIIDTPNQERANRRAVTEVSGFVQSNGLVLNGKYAEIVFRDYVTSATQQQGTTPTSTGQITQ